MPFIFLSYSKDNYDEAYALSQRLINDGFDVWMFAPHLMHIEWWLQIRRALNQCTVFLHYVTPQSVTSRWVSRENLIAQSQHIFHISFSTISHQQQIEQFGLLSPEMPTEIILDYVFMLEQLRKKLPQKSTKANNVTGSLEGDYPESLLKIEFSINLCNTSPVATTITEADPHDWDWCSVPSGNIQLTYPTEHHHCLVDTFEIMQFPVMRSQYAAFIQSGYQQSEFWTDAGWQWGNTLDRPFMWDDFQAHDINLPVIGVSWFEAFSFTKWLTANSSDYMYSLPTDQQYQRALCGDDCTRYSWGDISEPSHCNCFESKHHMVTDVNQYADYANEYGIRDLTGNVWEWCLNLWDAPLENQAAGMGRRVVRGSSWHDPMFMGSTQSRYRDDPDYRGNDMGFRVVRTPK